MGSSLGGALGTIGSGISGAVGDAGGFLSSLFGGGSGGGIPAVPDAGVGAVGAAPVASAPTSPAITAGPSASAVADPLGLGGGTGGATGIGGGSDVLSQYLGGGSGVTPNLPAQTITTDPVNIPGLNAGGATPAAPTTPASASTPAASRGLFGNNPALQTALGTGVVGLDLLKGLQTPPGVSSLKDLAGQEKNLATAGQAQEWAGNNGVLPAGANAKVQQNLNASIAAIKSNYAKMGMSGSSAETADINAAQQAALAETFQIGQGLAQQGLSEVTSATGLEGTLLGQILQAETAQDTALGQSLAGFAGATAH